MSTGHKTNLQDLIADVLEVEPESVTDHAEFVADLDADSLRVIEILSRMEKTFGVQIAQSNLARMTSLAQVEKILDAAMAEKV